MNYFILNGEEAAFPSSISEVSAVALHMIREARPSDQKAGRIRHSAMSDILLAMGIWTEKQIYALTHTTKVPELIQSDVFLVLNTLMTVDLGVHARRDLFGYDMTSFEDASLQDALDFYYRGETGVLENKAVCIAKRIPGDWELKRKLARVMKLDAVRFEAAFQWLIQNYNLVSNMGTRQELRVEDDYIKANKPSPRVKAIYDLVGWDLIIEQLPNFTLCKGMNESQILQIPYGKVLDELVKIKRMNLANWYSHKEEEARQKQKMDNERNSKKRNKR